MRRFQADLILIFVAMVWGTGFVSQRAVANQVGVFAFNACRFLIGAVLILPLAARQARLPRGSWPWLGLTGLLLAGASAFQQAGIRYTSTANAAFLTGLYVVLVPLLLAFAWRRHITIRLWIAAGMATTGIWLLSGAGKLNLAPGDGLELAGAVLWALHVIVVGYLATRINAYRLAAGQFLVAGVLSLGVSLFIDITTLASLSKTGWAIAYNGVFSVALGFTLQVLGQKTAPPADAALLLSMEGVFAAVFGYLLLQEGLLPIQVIGCGFILAAILLSQIPLPAARSAK